MKTKSEAIQYAKSKLKTNHEDLVAEYERDLESMNPDFPRISLRGGEYTEDARNRAIRIFEGLGWQCEYLGYWLRLT